MEKFVLQRMPWPGDQTFCYDTRLGGVKDQDFELLQPFSYLRGLRGLVVSFTETSLTCHGMRNCQDVRQSGYQIQGRVSVEGRKRKVFSDSILVETSDKKLCKIAVLVLFSEKGRLT